MPRTDVPLSAGEQVARTDSGGMAAEVRQQHVLKCFERNVMALLARITEVALGKTRVADLRPARHCPPPRLMNEVKPAARAIIPVEFVCTRTGWTESVRLRSAVRRCDGAGFASTHHLTARGVRKNNASLVK